MSIDLKLNVGLTDEQLELKNSLYKEFIEKNPDIVRTTTGPGFIPHSSSIEDYVDAVKLLIDNDQANNSRKIRLMDEYSYVNIFENPDQPGEDLAGVVTYSMVERTPGTTEGGNTPHSRKRREVIPQLRGTTIDEKESPGQVIIHKGQWFDNYVCFKMVARTNTQANKMALWFEELMETSREFFAYHGIVRYYFDRRGKDEYVKDGEVGQHSRPLFFHVRTERIYDITENLINRLVILLSKS